MSNQLSEGLTPSAMATELPNTAQLEALQHYGKRDTSKVVVRFKAITASNRFQAVIQFLRKELGWQPTDPLFTYINLAFSPAPDDTVANLFKVRSHSNNTTAAWG
ncbi:hypothetical protein B0J17DRAFT_657263 [Rhizoctonia solani]|nr:hypothetical protein B0J17DRAFT_657263 [Rhizoctonia solani]